MLSKKINVFINKYIFFIVYVRSLIFMYFFIYNYVMFFVMFIIIFVIIIVFNCFYFVNFNYCNYLFRIYLSFYINQLDIMRRRLSKIATKSCCMFYNMKYISFAFNNDFETCFNKFFLLSTL